MSKAADLQQVNVHDATHVMLADGTLVEIASKWGVGLNGSLAKPSQGGFGVITTTGLRVGMFDAHSYYRRRDK